MKWTFKIDPKEIKFQEFTDFNEVKFKQEIFQEENPKFLNFKEVCFQNCKFINITFDNLYLNKVKFIGCEFINTSFWENQFNKVIIENSKLSNTSIFACNIKELTINDSFIQYSKLENNTITNSEFINTKLKENIHRKSKYNLIFDRCRFESDNFIDVKFKECNLKTSHFNNVNLNIDDLLTSTVSVLNILELLETKGIIVED